MRAHLIVERNARALRGFWLTILTGAVEPVLYLFSIGVGLGSMIDGIEVSPGRVIGYATYVAPALLAAAAMNGAIFDAAHNVFWKLNYQHIYQTVLAAPMSVLDVAVGEVSWALLRGAFYALMFVSVAAAVGVVPLLNGVLAVGAALLIGLAFAGVGLALATLMRTWQDFDLLQLAMLPMFLFSATFYPLSQMPEVLRPIVQLSPLYHAAQLCRDVMLGMAGLGTLVHVAVLVGLGVAGTLVASRRLRATLLV